MTTQNYLNAFGDMTYTSKHHKGSAWAWEFSLIVLGVLFIFSAVTLKKPGALVCSALMLLGAFFLIRFDFDSRPNFTLSPAGITTRSYGVIPWESIGGLQLIRPASHRYSTMGCRMIITLKDCSFAVKNELSPKSEQKLTKKMKCTVPIEDFKELTKIDSLFSELRNTL